MAKPVSKKSAPKAARQSAPRTRRQAPTAPRKIVPKSFAWHLARSLHVEGQHGHDAPKLADCSVCQDILRINERYERAKQAATAA